MDEDRWEDMSEEEQRVYATKMREYRALRKELLPLQKKLDGLALVAALD